MKNHGFVYFVQAGDGAIKIGYSDNPRRRLSDLQVSSPEQLTLLGATPGTYLTESAFHWYLRKFALRGEWFKPEPFVFETITKAMKEERSYTRKIVERYRRYHPGDKRGRNGLKEVLATLAALDQQHALR